MLVWLRSDDTARRPTRSTWAKEPLIEIDPDEVAEESSSKAGEADADGFELCKRAHGEVLSTSGTVGQDPPEEAWQDKRQDPMPSMAAQSSTVALDRSKTSYY